MVLDIHKMNGGKEYWIYENSANNRNYAHILKQGNETIINGDPNLAQKVMDMELKEREVKAQEKIANKE